MPAFNESEGISSFLAEINSHLHGFSATFVVVDDCSTDATSQVLHEIKEQAVLNLEVIRNERNLGHGPSTKKALLAGLALGAEVVVACDGDGQINGEDVCRIANTVNEAGVNYVEGVRLSRSDAVYRRVVSHITRLLVYVRCRKLPRDANTPFRAYRRETLSSVMNSGQIGDVVPNMDISAYVRNTGVSLVEISIRSRPRRGADVIGSTWARGSSFLPSRRFFRFCVKAMVDWKRRSLR